MRTRVVKFLADYIQNLAADNLVQITREQAWQLHLKAEAIVLKENTNWAEKEERYLRVLWDLINNGEHEFTPDPRNIGTYYPPRL